MRKRFSQLDTRVGNRFKQRKRGMSGAQMFNGKLNLHALNGVLDDVEYGKPTGLKNRLTSDFIPVRPNTSYSITFDFEDMVIAYYFEYDAEQKADSATREHHRVNSNHVHFVTTSETHYIRFAVRRLDDSMFTSADVNLPIMMNEGNEALPYEPYI